MEEKVENLEERQEDILLILDNNEKDRKIKVDKEELSQIDELSKLEKEHFNNIRRLNENISRKRKSMKKKFLE